MNPRISKKIFDRKRHRVQIMGFYGISSSTKCCSPIRVNQTYTIGKKMIIQIIYLQLGRLAWRSEGYFSNFSGNGSGKKWSQKYGWNWCSNKSKNSESLNKIVKMLNNSGGYLKKKQRKILIGFKTLKLKPNQRISLQILPPPLLFQIQKF